MDVVCQYDPCPSSIQNVALPYDQECCVDESHEVMSMPTPLNNSENSIMNNQQNAMFVQNDDVQPQRNNQLQDLTTDVEASITDVDDVIVDSIVDDPLSTCLKSSSDDVNVLMC